MVHAYKRTMAWVNVLGGIAVLGSYAYGLLTHPTTGNDLWGEVPSAVQPLYTLCMFVAAAGYLLFTYFLFFHVDPEAARVAGRFGFQVFNVLYGIILAPSALWMPLTFKMLERSSGGLWLAIRLVLWVVGLGSVAFVGALLTLWPRQPVRIYWLAVAGSVGFTVQTALLDAVVWVAYFPT